MLYLINCMSIQVRKITYILTLDPLVLSSSESLMTEQQMPID